jgi:hypothetical protein
MPMAVVAQSAALKPLPSERIGGYNRATPMDTQLDDGGTLYHNGGTMHWKPS